jgi:hypothetical protein
VPLALLEALSRPLLRERPKVRYACVEEHREAHDVVMMCRVLGVSRSGYYKWRSRPGGDRRVAQVRLLLRSGRCTGRAEGRTEPRGSGVSCGSGGSNAHAAKSSN